MVVGSIAHDGASATIPVTDVKDVVVIVIVVVVEATGRKSTRPFHFLEQLDW